MAKYEVLIRKTAADELGRIPKNDLRRIVARILSLGDDPRPKGSEKLSVQERYRIRQGDYRVIYAVEDGLRTVEIVKIGHRSEVYRD
jgi:mRNA interferase RelE/StbE